MAGNKFDIESKKLQPKKYKLIHTGLYDDEMSIEGNARQIVMHILNQHL